MYLLLHKIVIFILKLQEMTVVHNCEALPWLSFVLLQTVHLFLTEVVSISFLFLSLFFRDSLSPNWREKYSSKFCIRVHVVSNSVKSIAPQQTDLLVSQCHLGSRIRQFVEVTVKSKITRYCLTNHIDLIHSIKNLRHHIVLITIQHPVRIYKQHDVWSLF